MSRLPDFIVIGAMKCATSTLHAQLEQQPGLFMTSPKEPNFFSNDEQYALGIDWYAGLFARARSNELCGESSTHYTKLPTYPHTVQRMHHHLNGVKLIYVMRHPIQRLVSQYIHEWTERAVPDSIDTAVRECPRLIDYSRYSMQLKPFLDAFSCDNVLPVFSERLAVDPPTEFERICRFIGYSGNPRWRTQADQRNVSSQRLRKSPMRDALVWNPLVTRVRRQFVPQSWRDRVKALWQMKQRPEPSRETAEHLRSVFDEDLAVLGEWLGVRLNCENFTQLSTAGGLEFAACTVGDRA